MKILLVRLRQIGDVVFTTPTFAALKDRFPSASLTYVVEPEVAPVVVGNADPGRRRDRAACSGAGGLAARPRTRPETGAAALDIAVDFMADRGPAAYPG